ncbi:hypothetical protein ACFLYY_02660 [Patescibacteria group bacterium]
MKFRYIVLIFIIGICIGLLSGGYVLAHTETELFNQAQAQISEIIYLLIFFDIVIFSASLFTILKI